MITNKGAISRRWYWRAWNVAGVAEELNFTFKVIVFNLDLNGHIWLAATIRATRREEKGAGSVHNTK